MTPASPIFQGTKRKRDHVGDLNSYTWNKEECLQEVYQYNEKDNINYTAIAKKYEVKNKDMIQVKNGGQVIKQFLVENEVDITKRVNYVKNIVDYFWSRWQSEYLRELREHNKVKKFFKKVNPRN